MRHHQGRVLGSIGLVLALAPIGSAAQASDAAPPPAAASASASAKAVTLPATPAGKMLGRWLEAYNSGDETKVLDLIAKHFAPEMVSRFPVEALKAFHLNTFEETGLLTVREIRAEREDKILVFAEGAKGVQKDVTIALKQGTTDQILSLRIVNARETPAPATDPKPTPPATRDQVISGT